MIAHLLLVAAAVRAELPATLSLEQAIAIAVKSSPALQRATARVGQSEAQARLTRSELFPSLSVTVADSGQTFNIRALGIQTNLLPPRAAPYQLVDARASVSQDVLNLPVRDRNRAANEDAKAAGHLAADARELLTFQVALAYAEALRSQSLAATLTRQVELAERLHTITMERLGHGVASKLDARRSEIQVAILEQSRLEAVNDLTAAKLRLANLIHAEPSTAFELSETVYQDPGSNSPGRADYRAAERAVRAAELRLAAARHERYPSAGLRANYGQIGQGWNDNLNTFLAAGFLNIPIYTGGRIEAGIAGAQAKLAEAKAELEELRTQIETETLIARSAVESARQQLTVARRAVQLAREEVELSVDRFTGGITDNIEILNAQDRLTRAEDAVVKARFHFDLAEVKLRRALGAGQ